MPPPGSPLRLPGGPGKSLKGAVMYSVYQKVQSACIKVFYLIVYAASALIPVSMFCQVIARYFFKKPISGVEELATACFIWLVIFGAAILFKEKKHIVVDAFVSRRSDGAKKVIDLIGNICMLAIFVVLVYSCFIAIPNQKFYKTVVLKIPTSLHTEALILSLIHI